MATCYIITYYLRDQRNYQDLYDTIKTYTHAHILESVWAVRSTRSASEIRAHLAGCIDNDDGIFVIRSGGEAAWRNVLCSHQWLKNNL